MTNLNKKMAASTAGEAKKRALAQVRKGMYRLNQIYEKESQQAIRLTATMHANIKDGTEFSCNREANCVALILICLDIINYDLKPQRLGITKNNIWKYLLSDEVGVNICQSLRKYGIDPYSYFWNILQKYIHANEIQYPIIFTSHNAVHVFSKCPNATGRGSGTFKHHFVSFHLSNNPSKKVLITEATSTNMGKKFAVKGGK